MKNISNKLSYTNSDNKLTPKTKDNDIYDKRLLFSDKDNDYYSKSQYRNLNYLKWPNSPYYDNYNYFNNYNNYDNYYNYDNLNDYKYDYYYTDNNGYSKPDENKQYNDYLDKEFKSSKHQNRTLKFFDNYNSVDKCKTNINRSIDYHDNFAKDYLKDYNNKSIINTDTLGSYNSSKDYLNILKGNDFYNIGSSFNDYYNFEKNRRNNYDYFNYNPDYYELGKDDSYSDNKYYNYNLDNLNDNYYNNNYHNYNSYTDNNSDNNYLNRKSRNYHFNMDENENSRKLTISKSAQNEIKNGLTKILKSNNRVNKSSEPKSKIIFSPASKKKEYKNHNKDAIFKCNNGYKLQKYLKDK